MPAALIKGAQTGQADLKKWEGPPCARMVRAEEAIVGRLAAVHIMFVLITSSGVVAAAANAPAAAPIAKSSCAHGQMCIKPLQK